MGDLSVTTVLTENYTSSDSQFDQDLDSFSDEELLKLWDELKESNLLIKKENELLEPFLQQAEEENGQINLPMDPSAQQHSSASESHSPSKQSSRTELSSRHSIRHSTWSKSVAFLYPELSILQKCFISSKKLEELLDNLENIQHSKDKAVENMQTKLEEAHIQESEVNAEIEEFNNAVRTGAKHPVTRRIIAQKVEKYFNDSIKRKMQTTECVKMQGLNNRTRRRKLLNVIEQRKIACEQLHAVDVIKARKENRETTYFMGSFELQVLEFREKLNMLQRRLMRSKRTLSVEEVETWDIRRKMLCKERLKEVVEMEKLLIREEEKELLATKEKIYSDPRQSRLPPVMDYIHLEADLKNLSKTVKSWKSKVTVAEQAKYLYTQQHM